MQQLSFNSFSAFNIVYVNNVSFNSCFVSLFLLLNIVYVNNVSFNSCFVSLFLLLNIVYTNVFNSCLETLLLI